MKTLYMDMDSTLVDFKAAPADVDPELLEDYRDREDELPGLFALTPPMAGAHEPSGRPHSRTGPP